jgi:DNA polymerase-3 subunit delta'
MNTAFRDIVGNDSIKTYLERMVAKNAIGNSLLFAGPDGVGKSLFAQALAEMILGNRHKIEAGNHPDLHIYRPEGKIGMHSIASMRHFSEEVYLAPFEAKWKVFVIHDAERMLPYSANALLKTFEEPALDTVIILLSSAPESLLPTILSRCRTIRFQALANEEVASLIQAKLNIEVSEAKRLAELSGGSLGRAFHLAKQGGNEVRQFVFELLSKGKVSTYSELSQMAKRIGDRVEESKKSEEELVRLELLRGATESYLTSVQKQNLEKEIEGAVSMRQANLAQSLFNVVLSWYRDMHLMLVNGNRAYLVNRDYEQDIEQALQRGEICSLETVQKALSDAMLGVSRSTPLSMCLERLFLSLNLL